MSPFFNRVSAKFLLLPLLVLSAFAAWPSKAGKGQEGIDKDQFMEGLKNQMHLVENLDTRAEDPKANEVLRRRAEKIRNLLLEDMVDQSVNWPECSEKVTTSLSLACWHFLLGPKLEAKKDLVLKVSACLSQSENEEISVLLQRYRDKSK